MSLHVLLMKVILCLIRSEFKSVYMLYNIVDADKFIQRGKVTLTLSADLQFDIDVGGCPECIVPDDWLHDHHKVIGSFICYQSVSKLEQVS